MYLRQRAFRLSSQRVYFTTSRIMNATRYLLRSLIAAACAALATYACAEPMVTSAQQTGYLQDYYRMNHIGGVPLEQVWIEPELDLRKYRSLYIAPTRIDQSAYYKKGEQDHQIATNIANGLHQDLLRELKGAGIFGFVSDDPFFAAPRQQYLTLETRITEIYSGDPEKRYKPGFGAGATAIQIEGKLIENRTCRTLFEFADRRNHPGDALWVGKKNSADSQYLIAVDSYQIMRGITKLFIYLREMGMPANQR
jgi:hypothetical protein